MFFVYWNLIFKKNNLQQFLYESLSFAQMPYFPYLFLAVPLFDNEVSDAEIRQRLPRLNIR